MVPKYGHLFDFYYCENEVWKSRKRLMGITWDDLPSLAFNMLDQSVIPYPKDKPIEKVEMFSWFDRIITR